MSIATQSNRRSLRIKIKAELIHEEAADLGIPETSTERQPAFRKCLSVWHLWRSLVDDVNVDVSADELRSLAAALREDAKLTLAGCAALRSLEGHAEFEDELKLMDREMTNIASWLADWPDDDSSHRDAARLAPDEFVTDEQFLAMAR